MAWINPLDLQLLFVNTFAGSMELFMIIAFFAVMSLCAFFRMSNALALTMFALFGVVMATYSSDFYFLVVLFAGLAIFYGIGSIIKK
jgi:hypothetical protein